MADHLLKALLIAAAVGAGLTGGLFFVFSNTIMQAFDKLPAGSAIASMQRINEVILNPLFFLAFEPSHAWLQPPPSRSAHPFETGVRGGFNGP